MTQVIGYPFYLIRPGSDLGTEMTQVIGYPFYLIRPVRHVYLKGWSVGMECLDFGEKYSTSSYLLVHEHFTGNW